MSFDVDADQIRELLDELPRPESASGAVLVVRMRAVPDIRSTGLRVLEDYRSRLADAGNTLVLAGVSPGVAATLERTGLMARLGPRNVFLAKGGITESLDQAYAHALSIAAGPGEPTPDPGEAPGTT